MRKALIFMAVALVGFVTADHAIAGGMKITSSDATSRFMALGVSKSVVIDLPADIENVVVADKGITTVIVQSKRRVYVTGAALGQTNIYFFGTDGRQIDALDIAVTSTSLPSEMESLSAPANVVLIFNGSAHAAGGHHTVIRTTNVKL